MNSMIARSAVTLPSHIYFGKTHFSSNLKNHYLSICHSIFQKERNTPDVLQPCIKTSGVPFTWCCYNFYSTLPCYFPDHWISSTQNEKTELFFKPTCCLIIPWTYQPHIFHTHSDDELNLFSVSLFRGH